MGPQDLATRWRESVTNLKHTTWQRGGERAVHKPLLLLLLIARAQRGAAAQVTFSEVDTPLEQLLRTFGRPSKSYHPEYPFWHLQTDGFWEIADAELLPLRKAGNSPSKGTLIKNAATGHIQEPMWRALKENAALRQDLTNRILADFWPPSLHGEIRQAIGLDDILRETFARRQRDPAFRNAVLRAYEWRCAVCSYDGRLAEQSFALEAAHIRWHCYDGPDAVDNALALCTFHHVSLDRGALGLSEDHHVLVSADVNGGPAVDEWLLRFTGRPILRPQRGNPLPAGDYIGWHKSQVFRAPART